MASYDFWCSLFHGKGYFYLGTLLNACAMPHLKRNVSWALLRNIQPSPSQEMGFSNVEALSIPSQFGWYKSRHHWSFTRFKKQFVFSYSHYVLLFLFKSRINLSPFTKDFRGEEHFESFKELFLAGLKFFRADKFKQINYLIEHSSTKNMETKR